MKIVLDPSNYSFSPSLGTLDFSAFAAFQQTRLFAVINTDYNGGTLIFSTAGGNSVGASFSGAVLTFNYNVGSMSPGDQLCVIYDDPTASQVISNDIQEYDSGTITGTPSNAINNTPDGIYCAPYRTAYAQIVQTSGSVRTQPEGSMDGNVWYALPSRVIGSTGNPVSAATDWTTSTNEIIAIPLDCNYVRLRTLSSPGSFRIQTYMTQQAYASPWAFQMLLSNSGRVADWGTGATSAQTLRVVPSSDSTITIPDLYVSGPLGVTTLNNNALTNTTVATDVLNYRSFMVQINGGIGISAGAVTFEASNDNTNWTTPAVYILNSTAPTLTTSAVTIAASTQYFYQGAISARYFRVRVSTGFTGGSIQAIAKFSPVPFSNAVTPVSGAITATVGSTAFTSTQSGDFSGTISGTTTSGAISTSNNGTMAIGVAVTAVSGTNPTCDIQVQESWDGGTNWTPLYQFERITAAGMYYSAPLRISGTSIRYVRTLGGTGPSFTMANTRMNKPPMSEYVKQLVDRTIAPNTLNSTSPVLVTDGCYLFQLVVSSAAGATVNPVIKVQGSEDNSNWYDLPSMSITATPSNTLQVGSGTNSPMPKFIRAIVSTAGTGAVLNYIVLKAVGQA